jgi:predicted acylesterase/phospholipase RssA
VDICIRKYLEFSESVFRLDSRILNLPVGENNAYFSPKPLEDALKKVIREETGKENTPLADSGDPICPIFVVTTIGRIADGPLKLFKSYGHDRDQTPIWQAARATSAAPAFFPPARVEVPPGPPGWYVDGGVRANNPSWEAKVEGGKHWKTRKCFIVSVGTGIQKPVDFIGKQKISQGPKITESVHSESVTTQNPELGATDQHPDVRQPSESPFRTMKEGLKDVSTKFGGILKSASTTIQPVTDKAAQISRIPGGVKVAAHIGKALVDLSTSSEGTHLRVWEEAHSPDEATQFPYFRFNVQRGMDEIGLEEWKMAEAMGDLTRSYLESPAVKHELVTCAEGLLRPSAFGGM